jgi:hypothetical protein
LEIADPFLNYIFLLYFQYFKLFGHYDLDSMHDIKCFFIRLLEDVSHLWQNMMSLISDKNCVDCPFGVRQLSNVCYWPFLIFATFSRSRFCPQKCGLAIDDIEIRPPLRLDGKSTAECPHNFPGREKLVDDDEPLFNALLTNLFTGIIIDQSTQKDIRNALIRNARAAELEPFPSWLTKSMQLFETCKVRYGIMILGPSGTGKTAVIQTLVKALAEDKR